MEVVPKCCLELAACQKMKARVFNVFIMGSFLYHIDDADYAAYLAREILLLNSLSCIRFIVTPPAQNRCCMVHIQIFSCFQSG